MPLSAKTKHYLTWLIPLVLVFLLFPSPFFVDPGTELDPSWAIAIHLAVKNHLIFGKDIVFTYGPLSITRIRFPIFLNKYLYLLSDLYFLFILFVGFRAIIKRNLHFGPVIFLFACVLLGQSMESEKWFFILILLFLFSFIEEPGRMSYLVHAAILSLVCFYTKVNSGLPDIFLFTGVIIYAALAGKMKWMRGVIILFLFLASMLLSAWLLHTSLPGYITGSLHTIKDYNDVMFLPPAGRFGTIAIWSAVVLILLFLIWYAFFLAKWIRNRNFRKELDILLFYGIVAMGIFVWYKSGFVRADGHVFHFFQMVPPLALLLYLFTPAPFLKRAIGICCWGILALDIVVFELMPIDWMPNGMDRLVRGSLLPIKFREIKDYFNGMEAYDGKLAYYRQKTALPNKYKDAIGTHSTDIIPWEISRVYFSGLNYDPRPTLQSYAAYNPYLDSLNASKYLSDGAPEYVLFSLEPTGDRFAWTDESRVKLALLQRYRFVRFIDDQLLLRRRDIPRRLVKLREETVKIPLGSEIPVRKSGGNQVLFTKFIIHYNFGGRLRSLLYQPPPLRILYRLENGDNQYRNAYVPVFSDGMILNKFVDNSREFQLFLLSDGRLNGEVRSFRIEPFSTGGFSPDITMVNTWYALEDKSPAEQREDSLKILGIVDQDRQIAPLSQPPSDAEASTIRFGIESYHDHAGLVRLWGWAMREKDIDSDYIVRALARSSDGLVYPFFSETFKPGDYPPDLRQRTDLDSAGVNAILSKRQLLPGTYQVGFALYNRKTGKSMVNYTDRYFSVDKQYPIERLAAMPASPVNKDSVFYSIDSLGNNDGGVSISGWAMVTNANTITTTALLLRNDTATFRVVTNPRLRPDIMESYKKPILKYCGFSAYLPSDRLPKGTFRPGVEVLGPDGKILGWTFSDQRIQLGIAAANIPVRTRSLPPAGDFLGNIDAAYCDGEVIRADGWAIGDTTNAKSEQIELVLKGDNATFTSPVNKIFRVDVSARYNNANCAFAAKISSGPIPTGKYQLGLILRRPGKPAVVKFYDKTIQKQ